MFSASFFSVKLCFKSIVAHANFPTKIRVARLRLFVLISLRPARGQEEGEGHGIPCVDHEATSVHAMVGRQRCRQDGPSFSRRRFRMTSSYHRFSHGSIGITNINKLPVILF